MLGLQTNCVTLILQSLPIQKYHFSAIFLASTPVSKGSCGIGDDFKLDAVASDDVQKNVMTYVLTNQRAYELY